VVLREVQSDSPTCTSDSFIFGVTYKNGKLFSDIYAGCRKITDACILDNQELTALNI
jgi:hypothetical protein